MSLNNMSDEDELNHLHCELAFCVIPRESETPH